MLYIFEKYGAVLENIQGKLLIHFLGLKELTIINKTLEHISNKKGISMGVYSLPKNDEKTFKLLCENKADDLFLTSRHNISQIQPACFNDIVISIAMNRKPVIEAGIFDSFIQRKTGREEIQYAHECLKPFLNESYGLIIYKEQIVEIAHKIGGYQLGDAVILFKDLGRKKLEEVAKHRTAFLSEAQKRGFSTIDADLIFAALEEAACLTFLKAHAVAYATIYYQAAYLKANFLDEYLKAYNEYSERD
jgi:DNA polymerase-3 subunit alpha